MLLSPSHHHRIDSRCTRGDYVNEDGSKQKFTFSLSLVFIQCIINSLFAFSVRRFMAKKDEIDTTTNLLYAVCAISYLGAMLASNKALQWVSYPTQVLGKSAKPIPVMVMGVLFAHKKYPLAKYFCVVLISLGVALVVYKDSKAAKGADSDRSFGVGELLLVVSLLLDGTTGMIQSRMRAAHSTKSYDMMLKMNMWSVLWLGILMAFGEFSDFISFANRNPHVFTNILLFGLLSALGQFFIFLMIANFGPLACSIATTSRKFFTVILSVLLFGNAFSSRQWVGTVCVFLGLGFDTVYGKEIKQEPSAAGGDGSRPLANGDFDEKTSLV
ncbi:SLC35B1 [Bugula neritina]|uniref:SLC35B1 n=1 Tax=Bugula neritina TaxID=10212 RepID=A0A7J7JLM8_BUGNE|nr:SLC35B1 [Bugula neritina]